MSRTHRRGSDMFWTDCDRWRWSPRHPLYSKKILLVFHFYYLFINIFRMQSYCIFFAILCLVEFSLYWVQHVEIIPFVVWIATYSKFNRIKICTPNILHIKINIKESKEIIASTHPAQKTQKWIVIPQNTLQLSHLSSHDIDTGTFARCGNNQTVISGSTILLQLIS